MLFVSLSLWKLTTFDIHCSPVAGLSGWMYILFGISGSAFPATIQRELWNLYLQSSAATMSIKRMYLAFLSRPVHLTLNGGNIRLWRGGGGQQVRMRRALRVNTYETQRPRNEMGYHVSAWIKCLKKRDYYSNVLTLQKRRPRIVFWVQVLLKAHTPTQQPSLYSLLSPWWR